MSQRYIVRLTDPLDLAEIQLPDGRTCVVSSSGDVQVEVHAGDFMDGYARIQLPFPEPSMSDHMGYRWEAVKTRKRH